MINQPIFFERNRTFRVYLGGKLFSDFFGDAPEDGFFPEEWIASGVRALNKESHGEREGVSRVKGLDLYFDDLLAQHKRALLGTGEKLRILVKILDSAIRLPAQAHPDRAFSKEHFHSEYGKTESWLILGTRPDAKIFFGFREDVKREDLVRAIEQSETECDAMEELLLPICPEVGEVYLVPAKTAHAIGKGCLILEIQEPTDFTIQPERWCGDYRLSDEEMYLGIDKEVALDCFSFGATPKAKCEPLTTFVDNFCKIEELIGEEQTDCFVIRRITLTGGEYEMALCDTYGIYIVIDGEGEISECAPSAQDSVWGNPYTHPLKKGDYFFLGACAMGKYRLRGQLTVVECY